jgi:hypothetical protein
MLGSTPCGSEFQDWLKNALVMPPHRIGCRRVTMQAYQGVLTVVASPRIMVRPYGVRSGFGGFLGWFG